MNHLSKIHIQFRPLLKKAAWRPNPAEMFSQPSVAKGSSGRIACEELASGGRDLREIMDEFLLAARLEHLIAVGGPKARRYLFSGKCTLNAQQIAKLCRRMPPFIVAKLEYLYAGGTNIDSNPTGAFDTNGWAELRVRLPKFAYSLAAYSSANAPCSVSTEKRTKLHSLATEILQECDRMLRWMEKKYGRAGAPKLQTKPGAEDWPRAVVRFAQALGVLRKSNRDLRSPHWRAEWVPTEEDLQNVRWNVLTMKRAANFVLSGSE